jgi:predicted ATPase
VTFVGRARELTELDALVREGRVVTVVGPAGVGRTRLVRRWLELGGGGRVPGGVIFCSLGDARTLAEVCASIACATGATVGAGDEPEELVGTILAARGPALVVLDGLAESSPSLGPAIARWIDVAAKARLLATAPRPLGIAEEVVLDLGPLPLGDGSAPADAELLFIVRAEELRDRDLIAEGQGEAVARLVRALGGLPLAIELAAARCEALSPGELLLEVSSLCARGQGALPAMIETSSALLPPALRDVLAQCAVFRGGFDVRAAEAILQVHPVGAAAQDGPRTVDILQGLRDASLLQATLEGPGSRVRLSLHAAVRAWADQRLEAGGARPALEERHAAHHLGRARVAVARLDERSDDDAALASLSDDRENLLVVHHRGLADPTLRSAWALEAAALLDPLLQAQGPWVLRESLLEEALLVAGPATAPDLRARALLCRGLARVYRNRPAEAARDLDEAATLSRVCGDALLEGAALSAAGMTLSQRLRRPAEAVPVLVRAIELLGGAGAPGPAGLARSRLGWAHYLRGRVPEAVASFEAALASFRGVGDRRREALALADRAIVAQDHGRIEEARLSYEQALAVLRGMGEQPDQVRVMGFLGLVAAEQGRHDAAVMLLDQGIQLAGRLGHPWAEATWVGYRGLAREIAGDPERARASYDLALARHRRLGNTKQEGLVLALRSGLDASEGRIDVARSGLEEARRTLDALGEPALVKVTEMCQARLENALARAADDAGDCAATARHRSEARRLADGAVQRALAPSVELRLAAALCARDPRSCTNGANHGLEVAESGRWFRAPGGEVVRLGGRKAPSLVLARLARLRVDAPGTAASLADVLDAGWPGHDGQLTSRETRVYTALWTLRRLGLGPFLTSRDDGVLIDPTVPLTIIPGQDPS